jgi:septal ring factor EnvC (AmiA/AmiB activator)
VSQSGSDVKNRNARSPIFFVLSLFAFLFLVALGIYETIPVKEHKVIAPDPTAQAIGYLETSLRQALDELKGLKEAVAADKEAVAADRAEVMRLSDQVSALSGKLEALQQSFASAPLAPVAPVEPARPKRGVR